MSTEVAENIRLARTKKGLDSHFEFREELFERLEKYLDLLEYRLQLDPSLDPGAPEDHIAWSAWGRWADAETQEEDMGDMYNRLEIGKTHIDEPAEYGSEAWAAFEQEMDSPPYEDSKMPVGDDMHYTSLAARGSIVGEHPPLATLMPNPYNFEQEAQHGATAPFESDCESDKNTPISINIQDVAERGGFHNIFEHVSGKHLGFRDLEKDQVSEKKWRELFEKELAERPSVVLEEVIVQEGKEHAKNIKVSPDHGAPPIMDYDDMLLTPTAAPLGPRSKAAFIPPPRSARELVPPPPDTQRARPTPPNALIGLGIPQQPPPFQGDLAMDGQASDFYADVLKPPPSVSPEYAQYDGGIDVTSLGFDAPLTDRKQRIRKREIREGDFQSEEVDKSYVQEAVRPPQEWSRLSSKVKYEKDQKAKWKWYYRMEGLYYVWQRYRFPVRANHTLTGFPIHLSTTDPAEVRGYITGAKRFRKFIEIPVDDVVYSIMCKVYPLMGGVVSVWLFLGCEIPWMTDREKETLMSRPRKNKKRN